MSWRIVEISSRAKLELKMNYLVVVKADAIKRIHLDEISVLIIENTGCSITASLLEALWTRKIDVIFCDCKHNPSAQLIPFSCKFESNARLYSQIKWRDDAKNSIWAEIVKAKIIKQAENIKSFDEEGYEKLISYSKEVEPGDPTNREAQAAKVYFNRLYYPSFSRSEECFENAAMNYGYSIILSCMNRQIVEQGYSTQLGIFHKSTFNQFNLGCDLVEPFRPLVDRTVSKLPKDIELNQESRLALVQILNDEVIIDEHKTTVLNAMQIYAKSVLDALEDNDISLIKMYSYEQ